MTSPVAIPMIVWTRSYPSLEDAFAQEPEIRDAVLREDSLLGAGLVDLGDTHHVFVWGSDETPGDRIPWGCGVPSALPPDVFIDLVQHLCESLADAIGHQFTGFAIA